MTLVEQLGGFVPAAIRARGLTYAVSGKVRIDSGDDSQVQATVRGSERYGVSLELRRNCLDAWCDCPYFESSGACKHIWATLVIAWQLGLLANARRIRNLVLDCAADNSNGRLDDAFGEVESQPRRSAWKDALSSVVVQERSQPSPVWPAEREILYCVDVAGSRVGTQISLWLGSIDRQPDGGYTAPVPLSIGASAIRKLPDRHDRMILASLLGGMRSAGWYSNDGNMPVSETYRLPYPLSEMVLREASEAGRLFVLTGNNPVKLNPLTWDGGAPWEFRLRLGRGEKGQASGWELDGVLMRNNGMSVQRMVVTAPLLILPDGIVVTKDKVMQLHPAASLEWIERFRKGGTILAPEEDRDELLATLLTTAALPPLEVSKELRYETVQGVPKPRLNVNGKENELRYTATCAAELSFDYNGVAVSSKVDSPGVYNARERSLVQRDLAAEKQATEFLTSLGVQYKRSTYWTGEGRWELPASKVAKVVRQLVQAGWIVEADGKLFRRAGAIQIEVSTGIDWFELHGTVDYEGASVALPQLLEALRKGEDSVRLGDGTFGMVPEEWVRRFGPLTRFGAAKKDHVRFEAHQAGLLDALLAMQPEATFDEGFARLRGEINQFRQVQPAPQPDGFCGQLRGYQLEGLGWMEFLRRFRFGGCLADDMGVGKTAQVLAMLETRRELRAKGEVAPSLVVVPRSLVFNWIQEAARFTPQLRILDYSGSGRELRDLENYDVLLTTYGTVRNDAARLSKQSFDYVILDEAQAVKNATSASAKAVRLLDSRHRLAMSGTPVENHLGELWSLFEFLNPGMLGGATVFRTATGRTVEDETRQVLAQALRPFILRRTKQQVARELPPKTEQTIYCDLEPEQRRLYNELREHYRDRLLKRVDSSGLARSKMQVLEALLRLRQAACHPGLIDKERRGEASAKTEVLLDQLREVVSEGHKALVFSQFTSLLSIVREALDTEAIPYEYLDGATRNRQQRVERFQNDPETRLFLISLKAGGLGLNLTEAEYVFLLDPWWNPAVEAQAVDRAHRIGQNRHVFAYRLIARDTVEEKVLELQKSKRELAAAIISADNSLIRDLRREDLELLLS